MNNRWSLLPEAQSTSRNSHPSLGMGRSRTGGGRGAVLKAPSSKLRTQANAAKEGITHLESLGEMV